MGHSPTGNKIEPNMNFTVMLVEIMDGKKATREEWNDKDSYLFIQNETLMVHRDNKNHQLILSVVDIKADDWQIVEEAN